jgi:hypothetical protein
MRFNRENLQEREKGLEEKERLGNQELEKTTVTRPNQEELELGEVSTEGVPQKEQGQREKQTEERSDRRL